MASAPARTDLLVDRQGHVAALRDSEGRIVILSRSASRFTIDRWLAAAGDLRASDDPSLRAGATCDLSGCVARLPDGRPVSLVLRPEAFEEDCARSAIIITPLSAPPFCRSDKSSPLVLDRARLASTSSIALIASAGGFDERPARPSQGWKPWFGRPQNPERTSVPAGPEDTTIDYSAPDGASLLMP